MTEIQLIIILTAVCCITYSFEIVFGLAGTILMITAVSFFYPNKTLVIYSILPQMLVTIIALARSHKKTDLRTLLKMMALAGAGGIIGSFIFTGIPEGTLQLMQGIGISAAGVFLILSPGLSIGKAASRILDFSAGLSHSILGISGPIVMTRLMGTFTDKTTIRNNALLFYLSINMFRLSGYLINRSVTPEIWRMYYLSAPVIIAALIFADRFHFAIENQLFKRIVSWTILASGLIILGRYLYAVIQ